MARYPEIEALEQFVNEHTVKVSFPSNIPFVYNLTPSLLSIQGTTVLGYIQDEYNDIQLEDPRVHIVLALRELEIIEESTDYLHWCTMMGISSASEVLRSYYQETVHIIPKLKSYFDHKQLTSFISDLDFQLNAGAMQYLRGR